jgi:putative hydrolase of HD superfamily
LERGQSVPLHLGERQTSTDVLTVGAGNSNVVRRRFIYNKQLTDIMNSMEAQKILDFIKYAEQLKTEYRNSFKSDGKRESTGEHSWSLALLVMLIAPKLTIDVNVERMLKIAIVHDLVEIDAKDIPVLEHFDNPSATESKYQNELAAMHGIHEELGDYGKEIFELWKEYADRTSTEALVVRALDKLDAQLQFLNEDTTSFKDEDQALIAKLLETTTELCKIDPFIAKLDQESLEARKARVKK